MNKHAFVKPNFLLMVYIVLFFLSISSYSQDLSDIKKAGVLRHLGIPYANFITGSGDGLDIEVIKGFAAHLDVDYQYVESDWKNVLGDLTGRHAQRGINGAEQLETTEIKGDIIANGMTILPWREDIINFSNPTFPSAVWLVARAESRLKPIKPSGSILTDISLVKNLLGGYSVLTLKNTCLDPTLYQMSKTQADVRSPDDKLKLNEMAPAILNQEAESTLLDVPDALIALEKWPGQLKVIGPISEHQLMGAGFRKDSPKLLEAFNAYLNIIKNNGSYSQMVKKYYPSVFIYYADFFNQ